MSGLQAQLAAAFALSLLGGVHCAGMCGGFVSALQIHRPRFDSRAALCRRLPPGRLWPYGSAGLVIGSIGASLFAADVLPLQIALLVLALA
jgi:uncharacterized protein